MKKLFIFTLCIIFCRSFPTLGGFQQIDIATAQKDPEIQALIKSGLQKIIDDGLQKGEFSSPNFELTKINSVSKQQVGDGNNYKISCEFENDENVAILASFQATYQSSNQDYKMEYSYAVKEITITTQVEESFVQISSLEIKYSGEIKDLIKFGVNEIVQKSVADGIMPDASYTISQVKSVSRQVKETALFYKCNVQLENDDGVTVETNFTVYYQPSQDVMTLTDYTCKVEGNQESEDTEIAVIANIINPVEDQYTPLPDREVNNNDVVKDTLDFGSQQITEIAINENKIPSDTKLEVLEVIQVESQIVGNGIFYKFTCKLGGGASATLTADFTVYIDVYTLEKKMTNYSYETSEGDDNTNSQEQDQGEGGFVETELKIVLPEQEQPELELEVEFVVENSLPIAEQEIQVDQNEEPNGFISGIFGQVFPIPDEEEIIQVIVEEEVLPPQEEQDIFIEPVNIVEEEAVISVQEEEDDDLFIPIQIPTSEEEEQVNIQAEEEPIIVPVEEEPIPAEAQIETEIQTGSAEEEEDEIFIPIILFEEEFIIEPIEEEPIVIPAEEEPIQIEAEIEISPVSVQEEEEIFIIAPIFEEEQVILPTEEEQTLPETETVSEDGFVQLTTDQLQSNPEASNVFQFGVNTVIKQGMADGKVPDQEFMITKVNKIERKSGENGNLYRISCEASDTQKTSLLVMSFSVYYQFSSQRRTLSSYSYNIKSVSSTTVSSSSDLENEVNSDTTINKNAGFTEIDQDELSHNSEIQSCIKYGAEQVIPNARSYSLTKINSVSRQIVSSAFYYKFDIELTRKDQVASLTCTVYYQPEISQKDVVAYSYKTKTASSSSPMSSPISWWSSSSSWSSPSSSSSSSSSSPDLSFKSLNSYKYTKVSLSTVESSSKYQEILQYGVGECVKDLEENKVVATSDFQVADILEAYTQEAEGYENCKLRVRLTNSADISLDLDFNVQYEASTDKKTLTSYSCEGSSSGQIEVLIAYYQADQGGQLQVGNCEKINSEDFETNNEIQDVITYGVDEVKKDVAEKENIDTSGYSLKEVKNVYREVVDDTCYRVDATLEDNKGSTIDCSFVVQEQSQSHEKKFLSYSYFTY